MVDNAETYLLVAVFILSTVWAINVLFNQEAKQPGAQPGTTSNYYSIGGPAQHPYQTDPSSDGTITYCPLDELSRPTCAYGVLTTESRLQAKQRGRQDINVNPVGWPEKNQKVTIKGYEDPGASYYGWFWNRSHMIADSLGGDPIKENLVTGTRTQNVGLFSAGTIIDPPGCNTFYHVHRPYNPNEPFCVWVDPWNDYHNNDELAEIVRRCNAADSSDTTKIIKGSIMGNSRFVW